MKVGELQGKIVHLNEVQEAAVLKDRRIWIDNQIAGKWYEDRMLDYVRENRGKRCIVKEDGETILRVEIIEEVKTGLYRHYKGTLYTVIGEAFHTETGEQFVLYRETEGVVNESPLWARPVSEFAEDVDEEERFKYLG